jgi:hypothetical protein
VWHTYLDLFVFGGVTPAALSNGKLPPLHVSGYVLVSSFAIVNVVKGENFQVFLLGIYMRYPHKCYCIE